MRIKSNYYSRIYIPARGISLILFFFLLTNISFGQNKGQRTVYETANSLSEISENGIEINGIVMDETKTKAGRDFFDYFYRTWDTVNFTVEYMILVKEEVFRRNQTKVSLIVNEEVVFQTPVQPKEEYLIQVANRGSLYVKHFLKKLQSGRVDYLQDMRGSGLY